MNAKERTSKPRSALPAPDVGQLSDSKPPLGRRPHANAAAATPASPVRKRKKRFAL